LHIFKASLVAIDAAEGTIDEILPYSYSTKGRSMMERVLKAVEKALKRSIGVGISIKHLDRLAPLVGFKAMFACLVPADFDFHREEGALVVCGKDSHPMIGSGVFAPRGTSVPEPSINIIAKALLHGCRNRTMMVVMVEEALEALNRGSEGRILETCQDLLGGEKWKRRGEEIWIPH